VENTVNASEIDLPWIDAQTTSLEELAAARAKSWLARSDRGFEVLRFREGVTVLESNDLEKGKSFRRRLDELGIVDGKIRRDWEQMIVCTDGAYRHHVRAPLIALFRSSQINKLRSAIRGIIEGVLDEITDVDAVDFMADIAWKIPPRVYCHLVSAPYEDAPRVARLSDSTLAPILTGDVSRRQESIDAFNATCDFVRAHLDARRASGSLGEDFTSVMIKQQLDGLLSEEELIFEGTALLQASVDNTVHQMGLTFGTFLEQCDRWAQVVSNEAIIPNAVEEVMRLRPRFGTIFRYIPAPVEIEGRHLPGDSWIFVSVRSANRDENIFEAPDEFRFGRRHPRSLQFGAGPFNCLGQTLARLELYELVKALRERYPSMQMIGDWTAHHTNAITEATHLRVSFR